GSEDADGDLDRGAAARAEGAGQETHARRDERRRDEHLESGRHRWHLLHADRELARGRHSRRLPRRDGACVSEGRLIRATPDAPVVAFLRPPPHRRRRRHALPALGVQRARESLLPRALVGRWGLVVGSYRRPVLTQRGASGSFEALTTTANDQLPTP